MKAPVVIWDYNRVGRALAEALQQQPDLRVARVCDADQRRLAAARARGWETGESFDTEAGEADRWWVDCRDSAEPEGGVWVWPAGGRGGARPAGFSLLIATLRGLAGGIRVFPADTLAYARLFRALSPVGVLQRCQATVVAPPSPVPPGCLDALQPRFDFSRENEAMRQALASAVGDFHLSRVSAPYNRSRLHMVSLEFGSEVGEVDVRQALQAAPRIVLGAAADGFGSTAHVQEFCRDSERRNGGRPELFLWSESVVVRGRRVHLVMDVEPDATLIPETIDVLRLLTQPGLALTDSIALTDRALGLKLDFDWVAARGAKQPTHRAAQPAPPGGGTTATKP